MGAVGARMHTMNQEQFEEIARLGHRLSDALRLEFINGKIGERKLPDGDHGRIIQWLTRLCSDNFVGQGEWASPEGVLMTIEVTSSDSDTDRRDRHDKPRAYAQAGIPVYLLIDRDTCEVKVHSEPDEERYGLIVTVPIGKTITLPDPVGVELDTEPLKDWVR